MGFKIRDGSATAVLNSCMNSWFPDKFCCCAGAKAVGVVTFGLGGLSGTLGGSSLIGKNVVKTTGKETGGGGGATAFVVTVG